MCRYVRQYDDSSCGPVAILNALKWAGHKSATNKMLPLLRKQCKCDKDGTINENFDIAIKLQRNIELIGSSYIPAPPIDLIDLALDNNTIFAIGYVYKYNGKIRSSHFSLCIGKYKNQYVFVNDAPKRYKKTISYVRRKTLIKMLRFRDNWGEESRVWFLDRDN